MNEMLKYSDDFLREKFLDFDELFDQFNSIEDEYEILCFIEKVFENWLVDVIDGYSNDYSQLNENWGKLCTQMGTVKRKIILVANLNFNDSHKLLRLVCDKVVMKGFLIRRTCEFIKCRKCNKALLSEELFHKLRVFNAANIPESWSDSCINC
jgi:hypothetical protein